MEDVVRARARDKGNPDKPDIDLRNKEEISTKKSKVLVQLKTYLRKKR